MFASCQWGVIVLALVAVVHGRALVNSGSPSDIPRGFDCAIRALALEYARSIQPQYEHRMLYDALQLGACGNATLDERARGQTHFGATAATTPFRDYEWAPPRRAQRPSDATHTLFVDDTKGNDGNEGSFSRPMKTLQRAIDASRVSARAGVKGTGQRKIVVHGGTYYLNETLVLTAEDSSVSIESADGEEVVVSGGVPLNVKWEAHEQSEPRMVLYNNTNAVWGRASATGSTDAITLLGKFPTLQGCFAACAAQGCTAFTYNGPTVAEDYRLTCYSIIDGSWAPNGQAGIVSGRVESRNIYVADVSHLTSRGGPLSNGITGLRVNGARAIRARFPDANPETSMRQEAIAGWIMFGTRWVAPTKPASPGEDVVLTAKDYPDVEWPMSEEGGSTWTGDGDWGEYHIGKGGACARATPSFGYWCSPTCPRGTTYVFRQPSGVRIDADVLPHSPYRAPTGAIVHVWRPGHWFTNMFRVGSNSTDTELTFDLGGFQGGEGYDAGAEWYIENVREELDSPNEWFFDENEHKLYFFYNGTDSPDAAQLIATNLKVLVNVSGTMDKPVRDVSLSGLLFRDTASTFMDPHGLPSGGDWGLQRSAAVYMTGCENVRVSECLFLRCDGNGLFIDGYSRNAMIDSNEFAWIGDSAMASWGVTEALTGVHAGALGPDGRAGEQPRATTVRRNLVHEIGLWQKQSSMWFQAVSCQTTVEENIFFNGPRANININDGFGGGNHLTGNLLVNAVRESSDHGPVNTWDRVPYITTVRNGSASIIPAFNEIDHNFILGTYNTQEAIDNDDGSSYYKTHSNVFVYGSGDLKSDFGGHDNHHFGNLVAYTNGCFGKGNNLSFVNNTCILRAPSGGYNSDCNLSYGMVVEGNAVHNPSGELSVCGTTFAQWTAQGHDKGSTLAKWPSNAQVVAQARKILNF